MADYSLYENTESQTEEYSALEVWLKRIGIILVALVCGGLFWLCVICPFLPLKDIEISGLPRSISYGEAISAAGITDASSYITFNVVNAKENLESLYQIESAVVLKRYPDSARIIVQTRKPAAQSLISIDGAITPLVFDRQGVIIGIGDANANLPIVSGLSFDKIYLGMQLPPLFEGLFERIENLQTVNPELLAGISEIRIIKKDYNGFDLLLYPIHDRVKFRVENELNEDVLKYMALMLDVFKQNGMDVEEVDLRSGAASYKMRG
ncbi:MAG: FtsQ-type POTRA domain-containing protein [Spirochaetaceae bacterium]|jgi:cell division protein FtsQ|nr:FtsQ-type POTRA domain-containing protein [Spirochaetaceae bacterium]